MSSAWKIQGLRGQSEEEVPFILIPKSRGLVLSVTRPQGLLANYVSRKQLTFRIGLLSSKEKEKLKKLSVLFNRVAGQARQRKCTNSCVRNVSALKIIIIIKIKRSFQSGSRSNETTQVRELLRWKRLGSRYACGHVLMGNIRICTGIYSP